MQGFVGFYRSALGKKVTMAVTGIMLFGFVLGHMLGNLKLYLGAEALNHYAHWLREVGTPLLPETGLLWIARLGLLVAVGLHISAATQLTILNRKARPVDYRSRSVVEADYAVRTMRWGGVIILLFILYHLAHFTWGSAWAWAGNGERFIPGEVYHNVVAGFGVWWVSVFYIVANVALGLHLYHGVWSLFQSLGAARDSKNPWRRQAALIFALIVTIANISFPVAVMTGLVE